MDEIKYPDGVTREEWLSDFEKKKDSFFKYPDRDMKIWRYMNFTKFIDLLDKRSLFFTKATNFADEYEGALSEAYIRTLEKNREGVIEDFRSGKYGSPLPEDRILDYVEATNFSMQMHLERKVWARDFTYINCWNLYDRESEAMWKLYCSADEGVVIQSTFGRLYDCLRIHQKPYKGTLYFGEVYYIDHETDSMEQEYPSSEFFYKRKSLFHELELRAVFQEVPTVPYTDEQNNYIRADRLLWNPLQGKQLTVDLNNLIEKVVVKPGSAGWVFELANSVASKYNANINFERSKLEARPKY